MAIDVTNISQLISQFRQLQSKDSVTPESLGYLLQYLTNIVATAESAENGEGLKEAVLQCTEDIEVISSLIEQANGDRNTIKSSVNKLSEDLIRLETQIASELPTTSFSPAAKFHVTIDGEKQAVTGADMRDMFIVNNVTDGVRCLMPLVTHSWGGPTKYVGIRIDHLIYTKMHLDFSITVHQQQHNLAGTAYVCMLRNPPAETTISVYSDKQGDIDIFSFAGFYVDGGKTYLVLEMCYADALMHISVDGLCCHFNYANNTNTEKERFSNYEVKLFLSGLPTQEITL